MSLSDRRLPRALALAAVLALGLAACGDDDDGATVRETGSGSESGSASGSGSHSGSASGSGSHAGSASGVACEEVEEGYTVVEATLGDFSIELADSEVPAGELYIDATNEGEHPHEIVVVKGVAPGDLPIEDDKVDEEALPDGALIGEIEEFAAGAECAKEFELEAGDYTLFCNVVEDGKAHVVDGMVTTLTVTS